LSRFSSDLPGPDHATPSSTHSTRGVDDIERVRLARQGAFFEQLTVVDLLRVATTTNN
jgi:hypothetical protein